jgi:hypothetical protein
VVRVGVEIGGNVSDSGALWEALSVDIHGVAEAVEGQRYYVLFLQNDVQYMKVARYVFACRE